MSTTAIVPAATAVSTPRVPRGRGGGQFFSLSDDSAMLKQIQATHSPDDRHYDVHPLLLIVEDIMHHASPPIPALAYKCKTLFKAIDDKLTFESDFTDSLEMLAYPIRKVSCELACKCSEGGDGHTAAMSILGMLSSFSWDNKAVISLAGFAVNHGEFWLVGQLSYTNLLAKALAHLKELSVVQDAADVLSTRFETIMNLMKEMLNVAKCIVEFNTLPSQYITPDTPEMTAATVLIPTAVYWIIRGAFACSTQLLYLIAIGASEHKASAADSWDLSTLTHKLSSIYEHLQKQLHLCHHHVAQKRQYEAYQQLKILFHPAATYLDNMKVLRALLNPKDEHLPLYDGHNRIRVGLEVLRKRIVLLLISDVDLKTGELSLLHQMYLEAKQEPSRPESQYEVVWLPVLEKSNHWDEAKNSIFLEKQATMLWHSVHHPSVLEPAVNEFVVNEWNFKKKPMLVVLDPQGKIVNFNAFHMMWIWGSQAFPFTYHKEEALWREESWNMLLLADAVDANIMEWMRAGKYICLYGGEDMEWIRKFTKTAKDVAIAAGITLEMIYVGKGNPTERIRKNNRIIESEKLSYVIEDLNLIWYFWVRLESMWYSKAQQGMSAENDPIMPEIMNMLSFDGSDQGWAVISRGSEEMTKAKGMIMLESLYKFEDWRANVPILGFVVALDTYLKSNRPEHHCNRLILPGVTGNIPERVVCAECGRLMEKFFMYRCCIEE